VELVLTDSKAYTGTINNSYDPLLLLQNFN